MKTETKDALDRIMFWACSFIFVTGLISSIVCMISWGDRGLATILAIGSLLPLKIYDIYTR